MAPRLQERLDQHLNRLLLALPTDRFRAWRTHLARSAMARGLWREDAGARAPLPLASRPWLLPEPELRELYGAARCVNAVLGRMHWMRRQDPRVREILPLAEAEADWLERYADPPGRATLFTRLDARMGPLVFLEANGVGTGGITYSAAAEVAMARHLPKVAPGLPIQRLADARELLQAELRARAFGRRHPHVALVEDRALYALGGEVGRLAEYLRGRGLTAEVAHPTELQATPEGGVLLGGRPVDVVFRFLELRELAALEDREGRLEGLRAAFRRGLVVPGASADLDSKATFELMSSPEFEPWIRREELEACRRHVAWTRLLGERRTTGRRDESIDLLRYVLRRREELVLKPDRALGGEGVVLGPFVSQPEWERAVARALRERGGWVVQSYQPVGQEEFPEPGAEGEPELVPRYLTAGVFATARGLAVFGGYSSDPVVNVMRQGGVVPVMMAP